MIQFIMKERAENNYISLVKMIV